MNRFIFALILVLATVVFSLIAEHNIKVIDFETCSKQGNIVLKTYPAKCVTKDGQIFWQKLNEGNLGVGERVNCKSLCGDGVCQEVVCLGEGCACAKILNLAIKIVTK